MHHQRHYVSLCKYMLEFIYHECRSVCMYVICGINSDLVQLRLAYAKKMQNGNAVTANNVPLMHRASPSKRLLSPVREKSIPFEGVVIGRRPFLFFFICLLSLQYNHMVKSHGAHYIFSLNMSFWLLIKNIALYAVHLYRLFSISACENLIDCFNKKCVKWRLGEKVRYLVF